MKMDGCLNMTFMINYIIKLVHKIRNLNIYIKKNIKLICILFKYYFSIYHYEVENKKIKK